MGKILLSTKRHKKWIDSQIKKGWGSVGLVLEDAKTIEMSTAKQF